MKMSTKCKAVYTLIMNIPVALAIALSAQLLATGTVVIGLLLLNFLLAYVISFIVGMLIPVAKWGVGFAMACKAKPDSLPFGLLVNLVVNFVYVVVNCLILTFFNVVILNGDNIRAGGGDPIIAYFMGILTTFVPIYLIGYVVSFLWNRPAENIARNICHEKQN